MITKRTSSLLFPRRLLSRRRLSPVFPSGLLLLAAVMMAAFTAAVARGDETTRRVQEELRKRNLYYGDIDGERSRATVGALRRYQERKGFAATGEPDEMTLRSLSIEPSLVAASRDNEPALAENAREGSGRWPTGTVLKSDRAPRPRAISSSSSGGSVGDGDGEKDLFSTAITDLSTRGGGDPPSGAANAPAITPPPASVGIARPPEMSGSPSASSRPPVGKPLSLDEARGFIEDYLRIGEANQLEEELKFYGDQVNYFNQGTVGRAYIRRDVQRYYRRWPERHFELIEPFVIAPGPHEGENTVRFAVRFRYQGADRRGQQVKVEGKTDNVFILQGPRPGDLHIVAMREQRLRN